MGRIFLKLNFYEVDEETEVEDVREQIEDLLESEFSECEVEIELEGHSGVGCEECANDPRVRRAHRIRD